MQSGSREVRPDLPKDLPLERRVQPARNANDISRLVGGATQQPGNNALQSTLFRDRGGFN
jgi:hypothetical protein